MAGSWDFGGGTGDKKKGGFLGALGTALKIGTAPLRAVGRASEDVGSIVAGLTHPKAIGKALEEAATSLAHARVNRGGIDIPRAVRTSKGKLDYVYPKAGYRSESEKAHGLGKIGAGFRELAKGQATSMLPLVTTGANLSTPEGRKQIGEHPGTAFIDVASALAPVGKAAGIPLLAKPLRTLSKMGTAATLARFPKAAIRLQEKLGPTLAKLPSKSAASTFATLETAGRIAKREVEEASGPVASALEKLPRDQRLLLHEDMTLGRAPSLQTPEYLDAATKLKTRMQQLTTEAPLRRAPEALVAIEAGNVAAKWAPKIAKSHGAEIADQMATAFKSGAENPFPNLAKPWNRMKTEAAQSLKQADDQFRTLEVAGEQFSTSSRTARKLARLEKQAAEGKIPMEEYNAAAAKLKPARFRELTRPIEEARAEATRRMAVDPGFGKKAAERYMADVTKDLGYDSWRALHDAGVDPVFIKGSALRPGELPTGKGLGAKLKGGTPDVLKPSGKIADQYIKDPAILVTEHELSLVKQRVFGQALSDVFNELGGTYYHDGLQNLLKQGMSEELAKRTLAAKYRSFTWDGKVGAVTEGAKLLPREVAAALKQYGQAFDPTAMSKIMGLWMVPIMWISPAFHVNNIVGATAMVSAQTSPLAIIRHFKAANDLRRTGKIDPRIPGSAFSDPAYARVFDKASSEARGAGLAQWAKQKGVNLVQFSQKMNNVSDQMARTIMYLEGTRKAVKKGLSPDLADSIGIGMARNVLQNMDNMSVIERRLVQQIIPFWAWKKTVARYFFHYPIDHPYRAQLANAMTQDWRAEQEASGMPDRYLNMVPVAKGKDGKTVYANMRSLNPMADVGNLFTLKGFLQSVNPGIQGVLGIAGYNPLEGGVPANLPADSYKVDPETGRMVLKPQFQSLWNVIPQVSAIAEATGAQPPRAEDGVDGLLKWLVRYGSRVRLPGGLSVRDPNADRQKYQSNLERSGQPTTYQPQVSEGGGSSNWNFGGG